MRKRSSHAGNIPAAFDAAHALKGVFANVGLTPTHDQIAAIVEPFRPGVRDGLDGKYARLMQRRTKLRAIIAVSSEILP